MKTKKIAIVGAGFSGLATAYYLTKEIQKGAPFELSIIESKEFGENASGISAGLLHPYVGAHSRLNYRGQEALADSLELLDAASKKLNRSVADRTGLIRPAIGEQQIKDFQHAASTYPDIHWYTSEQFTGIFIESAHTVKTKLYLQGLWEICQEAGARWIQQKVESIKDLNEYDFIFLTAGADTSAIHGGEEIPIRPLKGQLLEIKWPTQIEIPINANVYLVPGNRHQTAILGATFERGYESREPDVLAALQLLEPKINAIYPTMPNLDVIECKAALRATTSNRLPLIKQINENTWALTGMGSKGLLYHALYAKELLKSSLA